MSTSVNSSWNLCDQRCICLRLLAAIRSTSDIKIVASNFYVLLLIVIMSHIEDVCMALYMLLCAFGSIFAQSRVMSSFNFLCVLASFFHLYCTSLLCLYLWGQHSWMNVTHQEILSVFWDYSVCLQAMVLSCFILIVNMYIQCIIFAFGLSLVWFYLTTMNCVR